MTKQSTIAKTVGVTQGAISGWLKGKHKPHATFVKQLEFHYPEEYKKMVTAYDIYHSKR